MLVDHINPAKNSICYTGSKNKNSIFTDVSDSYHSLVGAVQPLIGLSDFDTPCATSESAQEFFNQDRLVEQSKESIVCLDVHYYSNHLSATFFRKSVKVDNEEVIGTDFCGWDIGMNDGADIISLSIALGMKLCKPSHTRIGQNSLVVADRFIEMSPREFEVAYLSSLKLTAKK